MDETHPWRPGSRERARHRPSIIFSPVRAPPVWKGRYARAPGAIGHRPSARGRLSPSECTFSQKLLAGTRLAPNIFARDASLLFADRIHPPPSLPRAIGCLFLFPFRGIDFNWEFGAAFALRRIHLVGSACFLYGRKYCIWNGYLERNGRQMVN